MAEMLSSLGEALYESYPLALGASFLWGLLSMILSPCHLVSVPLVMGYLNRDSSSRSMKSRFVQALVFAGGMTVSIVLIGFITILLGRIAGDIGSIGNTVLALMLVYVGLSLTGLISLPLPGVSRTPGGKGKGLSGALVIGIILGAALGPCTFAFMAPVLALMFSMGTERLGMALLPGVFFAAGNGIVVVIAGTYSDRLQGLLNWSGSSRTAGVFRIVCGSLVILGGLYLLLKAL